MNKKFYQSKTFWANVIGVAFIVIGKEQVDPAVSGQILAVINIILRFITKEPISW